MAVELSFSPETIMEVWKEWEMRHPGCVAKRDMTADEFAKAMMKKIKATAKIVPDDIHG